MPKSISQPLSGYLETLRNRGSQSIKAIENEFEKTVSWFENLRDSIKSGEIDNSTVLIPQTPKAPMRCKGHRLQHIEDLSLPQVNPKTSDVVTSSASITRSSRSGLRKTSRTTNYYEGDENEEISLASSGSPFHEKAKKLYPKTSKKMDHTLSKQSMEFNLKNIKEESRESLQAEEDSFQVFAVPIPLKKTKKKTSRSSKVPNKECDSTSVSSTDASPQETRNSFLEESIGANSTSVKESIGANRTYVKESIGANRTYVKESIGANRTYVKESIGANSTYVKESIGGNRTYVKESIGANSTYVVDDSTNSGNASDVRILDCTKTIDENDDNTSVREASRMAVEEAMNGPTRLTRTKAKAVAKDAAQAVRNKLSADACDPQKSGSGKRSVGLQSQDPEKRRGNEMKATMKMARKSLNRAKQVAIGKEVSSAGAKGPVCIKPDQFYKKVFKINHVRSASQNESASGTFAHSSCKHKRKRTVSHNSDKEWSKEPRFAQPRQIPADTHKVREDRLQELAAKTLNVCKKKEEMLKKQTEERAKWRQQKRERVLSARDEKERERVMLRLIQDNEQREQQRIQEAENRKKVEKQAKEKATKELHLQRLAQDGLSYLAKPLDARAELPHSSKSKGLPAAKPCNTNYAYEITSYDLTLNPEDRQPVPSKDANNYGLDDVNSGDSSDDESAPKKMVPQWAQATARQLQLLLQHEIPLEPLRIFFGSKKSTPDLTKMFDGIDRRILHRRSSAVWHSP